MQAGPWYITVPCLSLEYGRHMKAALRGPAAHYFVFINITLAEAQNRDPWQLRNCRLIHLFQLGQQHNASFTLPHTPNDNGTSTTGMRAAGVRPCCHTPLFVCSPVSLQATVLARKTLWEGVIDQCPPFWQPDVSAWASLPLWLCSNASVC